MSLLRAQLPGVNPALAIAFMRRIGAPSWLLMSDGKPRPFSENSADAAARWIMGEQMAGKPVLVVLPTLADGHWFLTARLPLTASLAALRTAPQWAVAADDFTVAWRLAEPVSTARAIQLTQRIIGKAGKPAIGEPVPVAGTIFSKLAGIGLVRKYPVRLLPMAATPGYRVVDGGLVDVRAAATAEKLDPRLMAVRLGEGVTWQPGAQSNGFLLVLGASGSGKTFALRTVGEGLGRAGVPVLTLDFHGDVVWDGLPTVTLSSAPSSTVGLNPLEIDIESARENGLYDQRTAILEMVRRAVPQLGHKQANALHTALTDAYAAAGIRDDEPATWVRAVPTFADLMEDIQDEGLLAGVRGLFGHPIFDRAHHLSIEEMLKSSMRLDLSKLPEGVRYITAETLLRRIFTALRMRGPIPVHPVDDSERFRLFVIIDEARLITMGGSSDIVTAMVNEARKFGLGMILASQAASHFPHEVRNNAASWLVLKPQTMQEARLSAPNIGVEPEQLMDLHGKGDGFLRVGNATARRIQVKAFPPV